MRTSAILIVTGLLAALAIAGCGDDAPATARPAVTATTAVTGYLDATGASRLVGNTFRTALGRLAVMSQPGDDAADLGQQLPTGLVEDVACRPGGPEPARGSWNWRCTVRWSTAEGVRRTTRYTAQLTDHGCLYANARPALRQVLDATTHAPAEDPLGFLAGAVKGC